MPGTDTNVIDGEIVDTPPEQTPPPPSSHALARRERRGEVLRPLDAQALVDSFHEYQRLLPRLLEPSDYQDAGFDKAAQRPRRFIKKSGWRKIATAFDLDVILVGDEVDRDSNGQVVHCKVIARAISPTGRTMDGDGYASAAESRFTSEKADASKIENDLRATASTRAVNRAISGLVGMGDVSAEEIGDTSHAAASEDLPYGPKYDEAIGKAAGNACVLLAGGDPQKGVTLWKMIAEDLGGYLPQAAAVALIHAADTGTLVADVQAPEL
jgi:hypothetical protein